MPVNSVDKLEKEAAEWLESVTGETFDSEKSLQENIKDGTILCKYIQSNVYRLSLIIPRL